MRKTLILLIVFTTITIQSLSASLNDIKMRIISSVARGLFNKKDINIYLSDNSFLSNLQDGKKFGLIFVDQCSKADLIISNDLKNLNKTCLQKSIFVTKYKYYENDSVLGVLFWQKGRPVLIIKKDTLKKKNLHADSSLEKYID